MNALLRFSVQSMVVAVLRLLGDAPFSAYLYGSAAAGDYRHGWSDIDLIFLTEAPLTPDQCAALTQIREQLQAMDPDNPYYPRMEGCVTTLDSFLTGVESPTVVWGSRSARIESTAPLSVFDRLSLLQDGQLLLGRDVRSLMDTPEYPEARTAIRAHLQTIRTHAASTRGLYAWEWLLDIARGLYLLVNGQIATKTEAARWALEMGCPVPEALSAALALRLDPASFHPDAPPMPRDQLTVATLRYADQLQDVLQYLDTMPPQEDV